MVKAHGAGIIRNDLVNTLVVLLQLPGNSLVVLLISCPLHRLLDLEANLLRAALPGNQGSKGSFCLLDAEERILSAQYNTKLCEISLQQISGNILSYLE